LEKGPAALALPLAATKNIDMIDTSRWLPRESKNLNLGYALFTKCKQVEKFLIQELENEQEFNVDNFESGTIIEHQVLKSVEDLLPRRYSLSKGNICDYKGLTSGEHDIVIYNDYWFPRLTGKGKNDKIRTILPIEGVYSVGEVKQTLTLDSLEKAMKKLVICQRLNRPVIGENRISENRTLSNNQYGRINSLHTFIIAIKQDNSISFDDIFRKFIEINQTLDRQEVIRSLVVLNAYNIHWVYDNSVKGGVDYSSFNSTDNNRNNILKPAWRAASDEVSPFYDLIMNLYNQLNMTILGSEDIITAYGNQFARLACPNDHKFYLK